ncbi:hypothetical protein GOV13_00555 [Candidatus Pacearchaeota archaeon]|nr:hypothetical protein [Candidatus Pacearchaeota archaeon]
MDTKYRKGRKHRDLDGIGLESIKTHIEHIYDRAVNLDIKLTSVYQNLDHITEILSERNSEIIWPILKFMAKGTTILTALAILGYSSQENMSREKDIYHSALAIHADVNKDNIVSKLEEKTFKTNLLKGKNAVFVKDLPFYKTGEQVDENTVKEWIQNYGNSK